MITGDKHITVSNASLQTLPGEQCLPKTVVRVAEIKPAYDPVNERDTNGYNNLQKKEVQRLSAHASDTINKISHGSSSVIIKSSQESTAHTLCTNPISSHLDKTLELRDEEQEHWIALRVAKDKIYGGVQSDRSHQNL